ncbi:uncharacterized protein LOC6644030 [Drosophila willistoni]|uniref:uncharacterized protein LOC6644030 n=1 Tax=Drosophila willistoni TaxID=7260 RepID=UPI000C26C243|nr:uncharacterized protein LOC6644030 [Drosophila willistoni]
MCKFTNRLFVFVLVLLALTDVMAKPARSLSARPGATRSEGSDLLDFLMNDYPDEYGYSQEEIHYDQRQKGEENLQLRLDGFLIDLPAWDDYSTLASMMMANSLQMEHFKAQPTPETNPNQLYQTEPPSVSESASEVQIINIPAPKKDIESRQHGTINDEVTGSRRTKAHLMQLLQMFRRPQLESAKLD